MSRTSTNEVTETGTLVNGYDYTNQAWVRDGVYVACGHPADMECGCYGREHAGESTSPATPSLDGGKRMQQRDEFWMA